MADLRSGQRDAGRGLQRGEHLVDDGRDRRIAWRDRERALFEDWIGVEEDPPSRHNYPIRTFKMAVQQGRSGRGSTEAYIPRYAAGRDEPRERGWRPFSTSLEPDFFQRAERDVDAERLLQRVQLLTEALDIGGRGDLHFEDHDIDRSLRLADDARVGIGDVAFVIGNGARDLRHDAGLIGTIDREHERGDIGFRDARGTLRR